jgi:hypothetical protein
VTAADGSPSERGAVVTKTAVRFEHDEVEAERESRERLAAGQRPAIEQAVRAGADPRPFPMVHRFLGQPEVAGPAPANLDHDERGWRAGIHRDEVELEATHPHVPPEDLPPGGFQPARDLILGGVTASLSIGSGSSGSFVAGHGRQSRRPPLAAGYPAIATSP